jgi:dTDP-4-amino-4,6-dideoxygalactose transaminase
MGVPFYNFKSLHHDNFRREVKERISTIIDNGAFVEGEYNHQFEKEFAKMQQVNFCRLVANGTDALEIALSISGIGPGDKVGVPGITFYATAEAVLNVGAEPVWIDIDPLSGLLSVESLKRVHQKHSLKAVMPVHIYGLPAPIEEIDAFCKDQKIHVIEDAAQAQGTYYAPGEAVGSRGNLTTFSFYPTKNLSAFGDAGCILAHNEKQARDIETIRNHGKNNENQMGRNSRCDHIQAAALQLKLKEVDLFNLQRKEAARNYFEALKDSPVKLLPKKYLELSSWHLFPIQLESKEQREKLQAHLKSKEIGTAPFYEKALSQEPALAEFQGEDQSALELAGKTLCLPMSPFISVSDVQEVTAAIQSFY